MTDDRAGYIAALVVDVMKCCVVLCVLTVIASISGVIVVWSYHVIRGQR